MNGVQIIKAIMKETKTTQAQLAVLTGRKNQSNISESLKESRNMKETVLGEFAEAMGYEVIVRKKRTGQFEPDCYLVGEYDPMITASDQS